MISFSIVSKNKNKKREKVEKGIIEGQKEKGKRKEKTHIAIWRFKSREWWWWMND